LTCLATAADQTSHHLSTQKQCLALQCCHRQLKLTLMYCCMDAGAGLAPELQIRVLAVVAFVFALGTMATAVNYYSDWAACVPIRPRSAPQEFIRRNFQKFLTTGSIHDQPRSGRPRKVPEADVRKACQLVKQGYEVDYHPKPWSPETVRVRKYYTSIKQAYNMCAGFKEICDKQEVMPARLLRRMHEVDPHLKHMKLHYKHELTIEQKRKRQLFAQKMLKKIEADPNFLKGVFYMDEASVVIASDKDPKIKVWADVHDHGVQQVLPCPNVPDNTYIKVHFVVVVNPEEGGFFIEMTTGTTDIVRLHNQRQEPYMVSSQAR